MEYTRDLGYCAAEYLVMGGNAAVISIHSGTFVPIPFADMLDAQTGRAKIRLVDIRSPRYAIAREYMIRLRRSDFDNPEALARLASTARLTPDQFRAEFGNVVAYEPETNWWSGQPYEQAARQPTAARAYLPDRE
jgi:6-phosphofructokinase 1